MTLAAPPTISGAFPEYVMFSLCRRVERILLMKIKWNLLSTVTIHCMYDTVLFCRPRNRRVMMNIEWNLFGLSSENRQHV